jgi:hypothetical protein
MRIMPDLNDTQAQLLHVRTQRDQARAALLQATFAVQNLDAAIAAAERGRAAEADVEELRRQRQLAAARVDERKAALGRVQDAARAAAATLLAPDPQQLVEQMDDAVPFLLLPLRIETKFAGTADAPELWVRAFPDDIAVALHEKTLTIIEAQAGRGYWSARARANELPSAAEREAAHRGAWNALANRHGAYRAGWIARATQPNNWSDTITDPDSLDFPNVETKPAGWTEAPRSFVLPDRLVVVLFSGTLQPLRVVGAPIPDDLVLGPDPLQSEGLLTRDPATGRIVVDDELRWLIDFERAVAAGMALRIPLEAPWNTAPLDRIVVLGIRAAASAEQGAQLLTRLFESHRYSQGMSIVPQGTPTNNTDAAQSGFTTSSQTIDETFLLEQNPNTLVPTSDPLTQSDGQRLATALGIPLDLVRAIPSATCTDAAEAIAMNRALWAATLGGFLRDMIKPLVDDATIDQTQRFFTTFVLGRGLLPALRVGTQPYGIVATSTLTAWRWSANETGDAPGFWEKLLGHLTRLAGDWRAQLPKVDFVGKGGDPFAQLLSIIGLQASAVEYYARKAVSDDYLWNYIRLKGSPQAFATALWEQLQRQKRNNLNRLGLGLTVPFKLATLTFWRAHDQLTGPVIDGDPTVPLAEDAPIRPYDGTHNYVDWLLLASRSQLEGEVFPGLDGNPVAPPKALLYQLLRHAYLSELAHAGIGVLKLRAAAVFAELPAEPVIANVGGDRSLLPHDLMNVDTAKIGVTPDSRSLADYLLAHARAATPAVQKLPEVIPLADMTAALRLLATLPTARLERAFAEHVDLCSYRLDAWIQGMFGVRLERMRASRKGGGIYIGAFGWVEHLRPNIGNRQPVSPEDVPAALRKDVTGALVEYTNNGGYVHAPSLTHALSSAVLRNAYLSHADSAHPQTMAVNLSSSRVRTAIAYLEGVRSGQELGALLGYQLERGLHEGHPGVELDEFIYVLRERFPLISKKLTPVPDGQAAEVIEARNVVNGYDLLDFVRGKSYPYGLAGLPTDPAKAHALAAEIDRLADAMDAIGDVLLAESVHQVVQGNYDRAKGVLQSITEGEAPPDIDVVRTPRSGRGLTHRVALQLDPAQTSGWASPLTARAAANAPLNHWLATILPAANAVQWKVTAGLQPPEFVGLDTLGLEPIDVVLMCGDTLGDLSSELERFLVYTYRRSRALPDTLRTFFFTKTDPQVADADALVIDPGTADAGGIAMASVWPLLRMLRRIVGQSRPLHANDFVLPSEAQQSDPANPQGYDDTAPPLKDLAELKSRVEAAVAALKAKVEALGTFLTSTVQPLYDTLEADPNHAVAPAWNAVMSSLHDRLTEICRGGIPEALPTSGLAVTHGAIEALVLQAQTVVTLLTKRLAEARSRLDTTFTDPLPSDPQDAARERGRRLGARVAQYAEAAKLVLGRSFVLVPQYKLHATAQPELAAALAASIEPNPLVVEEWLQSVARVRGPVEAVSWIMTYHDWLHPAALRLVPVQLPVHAGDAWIGTAFGDRLIAGDVVSITLWNPPADVAAAQCGLLIDEWSEVVPTATETTGIAFHYNRPNAAPPQALLLAITPERRGTWRWEDLLAIVVDTLERAQLRAVEPDMINATEYFQLMPAVLTEFGARATLASTVLAFNSAARTTAVVGNP